LTKSIYFWRRNSEFQPYFSHRILVIIFSAHKAKSFFSFHIYRLHRRKCVQSKNDPRCIEGRSRKERRERLPPDHDRDPVAMAQRHHIAGKQRYLVSPMCCKGDTSLYRRETVGASRVDIPIQPSS